MKELAETKQFPLYQLALIHSYEFCPYPDSLKFQPQSFPPWLQIRAAEAFYKRKKKFKNLQHTFESAKYLGKHNPYKESRVSYLKHALSLAKEQNKTKEEETLKNLLYKEAPRFKSNPSLEDYLPVAEDYKSNRNFQKARFFYRKILNTSKVSFYEKNKAFQRLVWIYKVQRNYKKQIVASQQWSNWLLRMNTEESLKNYYNNQLNLAKSYWNLDENLKAISVIDEILKDSKADVIKEQAYWIRGLISEQEKDFENSLQDWDHAIHILEKGKKNQSLLEQILWKKAWLLRTQGKYRNAFAILQKLEKMTENPYTKYKVLFWKGQTQKNLRRYFPARQTFNRLIQMDLFGYYGLMARYLEDMDLDIQKPEDFSLNISAVNKKSQEIVHWLILFKESELLSLFLDSHKNFISKKQDKTKEDWLALISLYISAKQYLKIFQSLEEMDTEIKTYFIKNHIDLLFPFDFSEEVEASTKKWNLSKAFVFALIRQESAFNKRARSPSEALGLMQMIPSTARQTARKFKVPFRSFRELYIPSKNILLGTAHLKDLLEKYDNSFILTTAAYNAGSIPVQKWREYIVHTNPLEFIENIPYEETRTYVRLLIRNYIFYHNILRESPTFFPQWIFKLPKTQEASYREKQSIKKKK